MRHHLVLTGALLATVALAACDDFKPTAPAAPTAAAPQAEAPQGPATMPPLILPVGFNVTSPHAGATVTSPLVVTGVAPGDWYFEAIFDAVLLDAQGKVLAEAPATGQSDWMTAPGPVPFKAELNYAVSTTQTGTIVLTEDQTGEPDEGDTTPAREVRIPVVLTAAK